jgi:phage-related protein
MCGWASASRAIAIATAWTACARHRRARRFLSLEPLLGKTLQGFGGRSVLEIVAPHDGDAYRAVYTVKFKDSIYVLHAFQKKSTRGIATPKRELDTIRQRFADAQRHHEERQGQHGKKDQD